MADREMASRVETVTAGRTRPRPGSLRAMLGACRWCNDNLEYHLMNVAYGLCTLIIFVEAARRYVFRTQAAWSPQAAIYLFIWLSWIGCAYAVKTRSHLRFDEIRRRLPYVAQFVLQLGDYAVWILLGVIISVYGVKQMLLQAQIGSIVQGTDNFPLWLAFLGVPFGWSLVIWRTLQCAVQDVRRFRAREPIMDTFALEEAG